jgi:hypothetical protein
MEVGGALNAADALRPEKTPAPVERGLGDSRYGLNILENRKISYPVGILTADLLAGRLIAVLTELLMAVCSYCCLLDPNAVLMFAAS